jgi:hypothetical protein
MRNQPSRFQSQRQKDAQQTSRYSIILNITWVLIVLWVGFLFYCWQYGLIDKKRLNTVIENVDNAIATTEKNILRGAHFSFGPQLPTATLDTRTATATIDAVDSVPVYSADAVHIVFSTDCTPYQDWQTLVLFHSAGVVKQQGTVTRIASGCDEDKKQQLQALYKKLYPNLPFRAHFTPDFKRDEKTNKKCEFLLC